VRGFGGTRIALTGTPEGPGLAQKHPLASAGAVSGAGSSACVRVGDWRAVAVRARPSGRGVDSLSALKATRKAARCAAVASARLRSQAALIATKTSDVEGPWEAQDGLASPLSSFSSALALEQGAEPLARGEYTWGNAREQQHQQQQQQQWLQGLQGRANLRTTVYICTTESSVETK